MKIEMQHVVDTKLQRAVLTISHKDKQLIWQLSNYKTKILPLANDPFGLFNTYIATLKEADQGLLFATMAEMSAVFERGGGCHDLSLTLARSLATLYEREVGIIQLEDIERWAVRTNAIRFPSRYTDTYTHTDLKAGSREQTYTRSDYLKLACLSIALRPLIAVWDAFICATDKEIGTAFKANYAYRLICATHLHESEAMTKLGTYIQYGLRSRRSMIPNALLGLSSEEYTDCIKTMAVVNRVCIADLRGFDDSPDMVITTYNYVKPLLEDDVSPNQFAGMVRPKAFENDEGVDAPSRMEGYKITEQYTTGEIETYSVFLELHWKTLAMQILPQIDMELTQRLVEHNLAELKQHTIHSGQSTLAQWTLGGTYQNGDALEFNLEARSGYHINREAGIISLSVAQSILWQTGHKKLAVLITSVYPENNSMFSYSSTGTITRVSDEQKEILNRLFPYSTISADRPKTKVTNDAIVAIEAVADMFKTNDWLVTMPDELYKQYTSDSRRIGYPADIKVCLADLAIDVASGVWRNISQ